MFHILKQSFRTINYSNIFFGKSSIFSWFVVSRQYWISPFSCGSDVGFWVKKGKVAGLFTLERHDPVHGLRTPNDGFFHRNSKLFGHGQKNWADKFWGIWGIFGQTFGTHFGTVSPLSMFSNNQPLVQQQKNKPLHISKSQIRDLDLNLGRQELRI